MVKVTLKPTPALMPVPITLVSTIDAESRPNIITLAWVGIVASVPFQISVSIRESRFSHSLIMKSKEFVLNIPATNLLRKADACGSVSGRDVDKFEKFKLTPIKASKVKAPLIKECPINMECKVSNILELGSHTMFVAEVIAMHADEEILTNGKIDAAKIKPIAYTPHDYWSMKEKIGTYGFSQRASN